MNKIKEIINNIISFFKAQGFVKSGLLIGAVVALFFNKWIAAVCFGVFIGANYEKIVEIIKEKFGN